jgi:hypothetical protein
MSDPNPDNPSLTLGGVTWGSIGKVAWITASVYGALVLLTLVWDVQVSMRESQRLQASQEGMQKITHVRHVRQGAKDVSWRSMFLHAVRPYRARYGRVTELINLLLSLFQLIQYHIRTYKGGDEVAGTIVTACLFNAFFIVRYTMKLALWEPGTRINYVVSFVPTIDVITIVSALLPELGVVNSFLTFTYLRCIIVFDNFSHLQEWLAPSLLCNKVQQQVIRLFMVFLAFIEIMSATVRQLEQPSCTSDLSCAGGREFNECTT